MISYRHHIVSLVAVFLALAVGIALGGGPLSDLGRDDRPASASTTHASAPPSRAPSFGDEFAAANASALYADGLRDKTVSLVVLPGADADAVSALGAQVEAAGGTVAGTYDVQPTLTDPSEKSLVDSLGRQLGEQLGSGALSADAAPYVRMGQLVGLAVAAGDLPGSEASVGPAGPGRRRAADLARGRGPRPGRAGGARRPDRPGDPVRGRHRAGRRRPPGSSSRATPAVSAALRAEPDAAKAATVDGVDTPLGQVTAVLALIRSFTVQGGSFGASGSDGAVPLT